MPIFPTDSRDAQYWRTRATAAEQKAGSARAFALIAFAVSVSLVAIIAVFYLGLSAKHSVYESEKVKYEPHSVHDFNQEALKTINQARSSADLPAIERWDASDDKPLVASFQGCALGLYSNEDWTPEDCVLSTGDVNYQVDALRFEVAETTTPDDGLPTTDELKTRLKEKGEAVEEGKTPAPTPTVTESAEPEPSEPPYVTEGAPFVMQAETTRAFVYAVGGNGGDWVVYIFSEQRPAQ